LSKKATKKDKRLGKYAEIFLPSPPIGKPFSLSTIVHMELLLLFHTLFHDSSFQVHS
jgi:hypothetical protein